MNGNQKQRKHACEATAIVVDPRRTYNRMGEIDGKGRC